MSVYEGHGVTLHHGDCLDVLRSLPDASVDSVVTDPPYNLSFMGKGWDTFPIRKRGQGGTGINSEHAGGVEFKASAEASHAFQQWCELWAAECLRVLKPGGHLLAFGGTRTWHRLACAVEDAGFEVRDSIAWMHGQGFPKSLDVSKAIDKRRDWSLVERLSGEIRRARADAGLSLAEIGKATLDATGGTYGKWYHRGGHMFFETGRSLPSRPEWDHLRHVLPIAPEFVEVYDEAARVITGMHHQGNAIGNYELKHGVGKGRTANERRDAPATPDAERWQGWGTALKPAFEPVVVARKPLASPDVNVLDRVEWELRNTLGEKEIRWTTRRASGAAKSGPSTSSSTTPPPSMAAISAAPADASATANVEPQTASSSAQNSGPGARRTASTSAPTAASNSASSETPSSKPMAASVSAATSGSTSSSPSTTSTAEEPDTVRKSDDTSTPNSDERATPTGTASSVGTATGLTGSRARVLIERLPDGSFIWPEGLPRFVKGGPLTVAANVLAWGTGALNVDGCRIDAGQDYRDKCASVVGLGSNRNGDAYGEWTGVRQDSASPAGRWPANVALDESQAEALDEQSGTQRDGVAVKRNGRTEAAEGWGNIGKAAVGTPDETYGGQGGASRFFFVASHDKGDTSALTGKGGRIESCETASTAAESSSPPRQFGDSALGGAVTSEHPDTASQTGSPSTSATPSGSRPSGRPATPTTQNIDAESSPEQQPGERTPTASPASSVGPSAPTVTTTTTTSPSTSAGSAAPATSDTTSQWKALGDTDSAPFKYVAKADATERPRVNGTAHPTVKPLALMRWLVRLVTPPGGTVLEPFAGSGTTVEACIVEGFDCIAIEKGEEYLPLIMQRIHRRRDPVAAIRQTGDELGLFELDGEGA